ncbi:Cyclophilin-type peptidyl-prolyl cis-trans isomerase domain [Trinorchestia longiramus]|nr:Cyclophilin-type peptidyl-prolyl cis-trans isomerase domain [Trinorchestia longiramus]
MALVDTGSTMTVFHSKYIAQYDGDASISAFYGRKLECEVVNRVKIVVKGVMPVVKKAVVLDRLVDGVDVVLGTDVIDRLGGVMVKRGKVEFRLARVEMACPVIEQATKKEEVQGQCLPGWWIQSGDFISNDGEGGKSALEDDMVEAETTGGQLLYLIIPTDFIPSSPDLEARAGAVEMVCVSSSERGSLMVASQFFIHVKKYSYTHVFAYVIEGLDLVERLTQLGDSNQAYYPNQEITIVDCGRIQT